MPDPGNVKCDLPLAMQNPRPLVEAPGEKHRPIHLNQLILRQRWGVLFNGCRHLHSAFSGQRSADSNKQLAVSKTLSAVSHQRFGRDPDGVNLCKTAQL
jgi:hypothetical protein